MKPRDVPLPLVVRLSTNGDAGRDDDATQPRSLFGEILDWMLAPLLLVWPMSIAATYLVASSIANVPFDHALEDSVTELARWVKISDGKTQLTLPVPARDLLRADDSDRVYYQVLGARGELVGGTGDLPIPREEEPQSPDVVQFRNDTVAGEEVRIASLSIDTHLGLGTRAPLVQVAETLSKRTQLGNEIIKGVTLPQCVILPIAVILVWC